jgi:hypothetical protein
MSQNIVIVIFLYLPRKPVEINHAESINLCIYFLFVLSYVSKGLAKG